MSITYDFTSVYQFKIDEKLELESGFVGVKYTKICIIIVLSFPGNKMNFLVDLFPLVAFAVSFWVYDIFIATAVLMIAMTLQIVVSLISGKPIDPLLKASFFLVLLFGFPTLLLQNEEFIQWKPTILYYGAALLLLSWTIFGKENPLQRLIQSVSDKAGFTIEAANSRWKALSFAWTIGLLIIGTANIYIAKSFELSTWVSFKSFVIPILLPMYFVATGALLLKSNLTEASVETKATELEDNS